MPQNYQISQSCLVPYLKVLFFCTLNHLVTGYLWWGRMKTSHPIWNYIYFMVLRWYCIWWNTLEYMKLIILPVFLEGAVFLKRRRKMPNVHRDPIKMHPFCLGLYFRNWFIKMKNYFITTISKVLSFISEILSKICQAVMRKLELWRRLDFTPFQWDVPQ